MNYQLNAQGNLRRKSFFADLKIGAKLGVGFGTLVVLIFFSAVMNYVSSAQATRRIQNTDDVRIPAALLASQSQSNLLHMMSDMHGYLALGDPLYRDSYRRSTQAFEINLIKLKEQSLYLDADKNAHLESLQKAYEQWKPLSNQLFELHDNQLKREPAYRMLATDNAEHAGKVIIALNQMINQQSQREPSAANMAITADMSRFQGNFLVAFSAVRSYVATRNRAYRYEYDINQKDNDEAWSRLLRNKNKLTENQRQLMDEIQKERQDFKEETGRIFKVLESDHWREDLYLFKTQAVLIAGQMDESLDDLVQDQQTALRSDLLAGRHSLGIANQYIIGSGIMGLIVGLLMAYISRRTIALPIMRLTSVVEKIRNGDLKIESEIESHDEIGILADSFNAMTAKLRETLLHVHKEKKRADNLLEVVIPIGVELTAERDFSSLLEKMLVEAKNFCQADAGLLLLATKKNSLRYAIVHNDTQKRYLGGVTGESISFDALSLLNSNGKPNHSHLAAHIALTGETINIQDLTESKKDFTAYKEAFNHDLALTGYEIHSLLGIPLKSVKKGSENKVNGILLLLNAQDPEQNNIIPFDLNLQKMVESFSSLATAAIEAYHLEQTLRAEVAQLRIDIDETKRHVQVSKIVESEIFRDIQLKISRSRR